MKPQECLLYVDPSPRGEWALALAGLLPREAVSSWVLLATAEDVEKDPQLIERARARVAPAGVPVQDRTLPGPAEVAVAGEVQARRYGMIVVPPAGRNAIQRMLKGSRVAKMVRRVPSSVLVARRPPARIERILAAVSAGPRMRDVLRIASDLALAWGAQAAFLHVVPEVVLPFKPHGVVAPESGPGEGPRETVRAIRSALREAGRESELMLQEGLVADELLSEVEHGDHHLLVVGGPKGTEREHWAEDVVERLLIHCPTSVLVVRSEG